MTDIEQERAWLEAARQAFGFENGLQSVNSSDLLRFAALVAEQARAQQPSADPFGYFRAEPFGWTDCAETDEGAIALYARPAADVLADSELLNWLRDNTCDLRCIDMPTGGGDADVRWVVIEHHMAKPHEREIGRSFTDDPRDAVRDAIARAKGGA